MTYRNLIGAIGLGFALAATISAAQAFDETKYPDLRGEWHGTGGNKWPAPAPLTAGNLMPTRKDQPPPNLKYFKPPQK